MQHNLWNENELNILKQNYGNIKINILSCLLPRHTQGSIQKYANKLGLKGNKSLAKRMYSFNQYFFHTPTIQNCYWAGFIAADGCIGKQGSVAICLSKKDDIILKQFILACGYTGNIKYPIWTTRKLKNGQLGEYCRVTMWGAYQWQEDLLKHWNITPRKSLTLLPPNIIDHKHILAFIIGLIDGDGFISYDSRKMLALGLTGSKYIVNWVKSIFMTLYGPQYTASTFINYGNSNVLNIKWRGKKAYDLITFLKQDVGLEFRLPRKWDTI